MKNKALIDYIISLIYRNEKDIRTYIKSENHSVTIDENGIEFRIIVSSYSWFYDHIGIVHIKYKNIEKEYRLKEVEILINNLIEEIKRERINNLHKQENELDMILTTGSDKKIKQKEKMLSILDKELGATT